MYLHFSTQDNFVSSHDEGYFSSCSPPPPHVKTAFEKLSRDMKNILIVIHENLSNSVKTVKLSIDQNTASVHTASIGM